MSANVLPIASSEAVDQAWVAFRDHAARSFVEKRLILDRGYMEEWARLEARFKKLTLMPRRYG
jgi:hypothetical protein